MKHKLLSLGLAAALALCAQGVEAQMMYGLTNDNRIMVMSDASAPSTFNGPYAINGMASGQAMVAIAFNYMDGMMYGLGYDAVTNHAQLYTMTVSGAGASTVYNAAAVSTTTMSMNLGAGSSVGFDFISTAKNQIKVTGTNGHTYIMSATDGTIASTGSTNPAYASGDINSALTAGVGATAFTNNYYGADAQSQFGYDLLNHTIVRFDSTDWNTLHTVASFGASLLTTSSVGMDSWYDTAAHANVIFVVTTNLVGQSELYKIDRNTGASTDLGAVGTGTFSLRSIATPRGRNTSTTVMGQLVAGLTLNMRNLIFFDSYNPEHITNVVALNGMASGQAMMAIAYRPKDRGLYGLAYNGSTKQYQLYSINETTGAVTAIGSAAAVDLGTSNNGNIAANFNPITDRLQVMGTSSTSTNVNAEINPDNGVLTMDSTVYYATGDVNAATTLSNMGSLAYTNSYNNTSATEMWGIDNKTGALVRFADGSNSSMNTMYDLSSTIDGTLHTSMYNNGLMDIYHDSVSNSNMAYIASNTYGVSAGSSADNNYAQFSTLNTSTGTTAGMRSVGYGTPVKSMAVKKEYTGLPLAVANVAAGNDDLLVYPNPVANRTRIELSEASTSTVYVDVIDLNGRVVRAYKFGTGTYQMDIDMSGMPNGLYSARVTQNGIVTNNVKLIKD